MKKVFLLEVQANGKYLQVIRGFVERSLEGALPKDEAFKLEMCLNEVCENIINHSYPGTKTGRILIKAVIEERKISVIIIDRGKPFNLLEFDPPDKEELVEKGIKGKLGIRTIKTICDVIHYKRLRKKNKITLIKKIKKRRKVS